MSSWKRLIFNISQWVWLLEKQNIVLPTNIKAKRVMVGWRASKTCLMFWKCYYLSLLAYLTLFLNLSNTSFQSTLIYIAPFFCWSLDQLLTRIYRFLPPSCCDKCLGSLWRGHIWVSIVKTNWPSRYILDLQKQPVMFWSC